MTDTLDLLWGAEAIAAFLGRTKRSVFHMLEKNEIPARKVSGRWVASKRALIAYFEETAA
ncbi:DNA-binding protein [Arsenicitalea aurantiaca]|uniref:DNA-binding protein n=1 Tax=Arsenicitalea aurantiaca TaxID=1783274 RepID=A0A433XEV0_9HYPH|nr:helix-turn-helix domain-containing protein [Arsenicitalea aurantiaca]RUT32625.1 DNA-binding protein [Arsenicitalea aurantiaca]